MSGFDLNKTQDTTKSVIINYLPLGITSIFRDDVNQYITADCAISSSSNITYTDNNVTTEYKANKLWIISDANDTKMNVINGVQANAQLIIRNINSNGDKVLFMCFPLNVTNPGPPRGAIDSIVRATLDNISQMTVTLNDDIFRETVPNTKYIEYTSNLGNNAVVIMFGRALDIISVNVLNLENNLELFNIQPDNYDILGAPVPGEWMECDYVPIDSQEVASYSLPVASGLIQDSSVSNSFNTMMLFIVFIIFAVICFNVIPLSYIYLLQFVFSFSDVVNPIEQRATMGRVNMMIVVILGAIAGYLLYIGIFADPNVYPNYAQYLLYGVIICVVLLIGYLIIESKKSLSKNWPIDDIQASLKN